MRSPQLPPNEDAARSPPRKMEQDAEGRMALNSQFPSLKADKFKTANVPRKMRPSEIYSSPRLTAPIRCACQPGSLLKNQDKAAARPHCPPNGWQREERKASGCSVCFFFFSFPIRQAAELMSPAAATAPALLRVKVEAALLEQTSPVLLQDEDCKMLQEQPGSSHQQDPWVAAAGSVLPMGPGQPHGARRHWG